MAGSSPLIFRPRNLDPFGDLSLQQSFIFADTNGNFTLNNQQDTNSFDSATEVHEDNAIYNYNSAQRVSGSSSWAITNNPVMPDGYVDATFCCFVDLGSLDDYSNNTVVFGEDNQRYNVEFYTTYQNGTTYAKLYLHKQAVNSELYTISRDWHHFTAVYDSANTTVKYYIDGVYKETITQAMNFNDSKGIEVKVDQDGGFTDLQVYNRQLTSSEISQIANNNFPLLPADDGTSDNGRTIDPFNDGNLIQSFMFENSLGDDQSKDTIFNDASFSTFDSNGGA